MPKFLVMDRSGHSTIDFAANADALREAQAKFDELVKGQKYAAARRTGPGTSELIRKFDPGAEEILFIPPMQAG